MWLIYVLGSLIILLLLLLSLSISLRIHTNRQVIMMSVGTFLSGGLEWKEEEPVAALRIFWWKKYFRLLNFRKSKKRKSVRRTIKKQAKKKAGSFFTFKRIKRLLQSFKVEEFRLNIDTNDMILNAHLYPLIVWLRNRNMDVGINFNHQFELDLVIQNRVWRILKAILIINP